MGVTIPLRVVQPLLGQCWYWAFETTFTLAEPKTYVVVFYFFCFLSGNLPCSFCVGFNNKKLFIFKLVMPLTCDPKRI